MTDKELRKLKRAELIEIMFYLQKELDSLKQENQTLKSRIDELTKLALDTQKSISNETLQIIVDTIKNTTNDCLLQIKQSYGNTQTNIDEMEN